jgi:hypothetical protein
MPKLATKYSRQIVEFQVMIFTEMKVLYKFTSLAIWCVSGEEWGNGMGRVLCMVVGSLLLESYSQITHPTGITAQTNGSNGYFTKARQTATKHGRYINSL